MRRRLFISLVLSLLAGVWISSIHAAETGASTESLASRLDSIVKRATADGDTWGIEIVSLDTGEIVYRKNSQSALVPASNMKLFTTAAALHYLGPDFTIKTSIYFDGKLMENGVLDGDVILYGRGDPNISGRFTDEPTTIFQQMTESLKAHGLREVRGDIIGDDSYFDADYYGPWLPEESHKWYAARVSALSFNDNCIDIYVKPGSAPGKRVRVTQSPRTAHMQIVNVAATTTKRNNSVWAAPHGREATILVGGKIWQKKEEEVLWFPVESPPLYAATVFKETLELEGIRVAGEARTLASEHRTAVPEGATPVVEHESMPLSEIIKVVNKRSQNLHAELLLKQIGLHKGYGPSFAGGTRAVRDFIKTVGIDGGAVTIHDGSGLCRSNRASAHSIVQLLKHMDSDSLRDVFRNSLAIAGVDNSLSKMTWIVPAGSVLAKTGSLKGVLCLSGYAGGKHERLAFSIIVNDFKGDSQRIREARDRICAELVKQ